MFLFFFFLSSWMMSRWALGIVQSVCTCWFHMVNLPSWLVSTDFGTWSYECLLSNFTPILFQMLKCSSAHNVSCLFMYCSFANIGHANMMCSTASSNCLQSLNLLLVLLLLLLFLWHFNAHVKSHNQAYTCRKSPPHPPLWHHSLPVVSIMTSADERWGETCVDTMY